MYGTGCIQRARCAANTAKYVVGRSRGCKDALPARVQGAVLERAARLPRRYGCVHLLHGAARALRLYNVAGDDGNWSTGALPQSTAQVLPAIRTSNTKANLSTVFQRRERLRDCHLFGVVQPRPPLERIRQVIKVHRTPLGLQHRPHAPIHVAHQRKQVRFGGKPSNARLRLWSRVLNYNHSMYCHTPPHHPPPAGRRVQSALPAHRLGSPPTCSQTRRIR